MKVLIIGGTGFISREIVRQSLASGHQITLINRGLTDPALEVASIRGDAEALTRIKEQILAIAPDIVVHSVANTQNAAQELIAVFRGHPAHLLVLSSMDCYDLFQQTVRKTACDGYPVDEDGKTCSIPYYWREITGSLHAESYDKNLMTAALLDAYDQGWIQPTVFRCAMVYGPQDKQYPYRHGPFIRRIFDRQPRLAIGQSDQGSIWTFGYVANIAAAIVHAYTRSEIVGQIYNLGECTTRSKHLWAELYAKAAGFEFEVCVVPDELLERDPAIRNDPPSHLIFDCNRYLRESGFKDPVSLPEAIRCTLEWGLAHPEALGDKPDYDREIRLISGYAKLTEQLHGLEAPA